jgi:hypothetical protein
MHSTSGDVSAAQAPGMSVWRIYVNLSPVRGIVNFVKNERV